MAVISTALAEKLLLQKHLRPLDSLEKEPTRRRLTYIIEMTEIDAESILQPLHAALDSGHP